MKNAVAGGVAGFAATLPMTIAMDVMHGQLPFQEQYPLPPREITEKLAEEVHLDDDMLEEHHIAATLAAHFAYGAACGALYGVTAKAIDGPPAVKGIAFGLGVWTTSYLGLLPSMGILRSAKEHPIRRNALMIAAHVIWGAATGVIAEALSEDNS